MATEKTSTPSMDSNSVTIRDSIIITDPEIARVLLHEDKKKIVSLLIKNREMTIQQLSIDTQINPGTIKRYIDDLQLHNIVFLSKTTRSEYNIKMKYYCAIAKKFLINIHISGEN